MGRRRGEFLATKTTSIVRREKKREREFEGESGKKDREGEVPLFVVSRRDATELFSVAIISPSRARKRGARRGRGRREMRGFLPTVPSRRKQFPSLGEARREERSRGDERERG